MTSLSDANAVVLDDPQSAFRCFPPEHRERSPQLSDRVLYALRKRTEHPDACVAGWWIDLDIGKVEIEGNKHTALAATDIQDLRIGVACEAFCGYCMDFVACTAQQRLRGPRKVLVELEASGHPLRLRRDRYDAFPRQVGSIGNSRGNMLRLESGVLV